MIELGRARITATDIIAFPKGTIVNIGELEDGDETASGADAEGGELVAYVADSDSSHDVDVTEADFVFIPNNCGLYAAPRLAVGVRASRVI